MTSSPLPFRTLICSSMPMKRIIIAMATLLITIPLLATEVIQTEDLTFYYPNFQSIDLTLGAMPTFSDSHVTFCCEAAFTGQRLASFAHTNVADAHVSGGVWHKGYNCRANTGAFVWYGNKWAFMNKSTFLNTRPACRMAFCQYLIILNGKQSPIWERMRKNRTRYRALCEKGGRLCLVESKKVVTLEYFTKCLVESHITNAIYLDMGAGWNYAWYRDDAGKVKEIFPESKQAGDYRYRTNWVTFYY